MARAVVAWALAAGAVGIAAVPADASPGQVVTDLNSVSAADLVNEILGEGVTASNIRYSGAPVAAGAFSGMQPVGFAEGIVLSSGDAKTVVGPNTTTSRSMDNLTGGDPDLDAISGPTEDAAVLTFDFVPTSPNLEFDYVFSSEEYDEYVYSGFNDVFGFFVNGNNCAVLPDGTPVSIDTINNGNPNGDPTPQHPELFRSNPAASPNVDLEADGLTVVLHCAATVVPNQTNTMKLAIADVLDPRVDSAVFVRSGSLRANQAPTADDKSVSTLQDTPAPVTLTGSDPDGDPLTFSVGDRPTHGTLTGTGANLTYTPDPGYTGPDTFTYHASDGRLTSPAATVAITVTAAPPANQAPTADDKSISTLQDTPAPVTLTGSDPDGDPLTFNVGDRPTHGTLTGTGANLTYTPDPGYTGPDSFTYHASDGRLTSPAATVTITVRPEDPQACEPTVDTVVSADQGDGGVAVHSPELSTSADKTLLLAYVTADGPGSKWQKQTITSVRGGGLDWSLVTRANATGGTAEIWKATATERVVDTVVTATFEKPGYDGSITVAAYANASNAVGSAAAAGWGGDPTVTIQPAGACSLIWSAGHNWTHNNKPGAADGSSFVHEFDDTRVHDYFWVQKRNLPTTDASPVVVRNRCLYDDRWQLVAVEIRSAG